MQEKCQRSGRLRHFHHGINDRVQNACDGAHFEQRAGQELRWIYQHINQPDDQRWQNIFHVIAVSSVQMDGVFCRKKIDLSELLIILSQ